MSHPTDVPADPEVGGEEDKGEERESAGGAEAESEVELVADGHEAEVRLVKQHEQWQIAALGE